jgi:hypothetical protein
MAAGVMFARAQEKLLRTIDVAHLCTGERLEAYD